jgi:hypothetical protein
VDRPPAWPLLLVPTWAVLPVLLAWACLAAGSGGQLGGLGWVVAILDAISPVHGVRGVQALPMAAWVGLGAGGLGGLWALRGRPDATGAQARAAIPLAALLLPALLLGPAPLFVLSGLPADAASWAWPGGDPGLVARARFGAAAGFLPLLLALPALPAWRDGLQAALRGAPAPGLPRGAWRFVTGALVTGLVILGLAYRELQAAG